MGGQGQVASIWLFFWTLVILTCFAFSRQPQIWKLRNHDSLSNALKNKLRLERVKQNILRKLNVSRSPGKNPRTLETPEKPQGKAFDALDQSHTLAAVPNISLVLAEATDPYRKDSLVFKIHTKLRKWLSYSMDSVHCVLKLRLKPKKSSYARGRSSKKNPVPGPPCVEDVQKDTVTDTTRAGEEVKGKRKCRTPNKKTLKNSSRRKNKRGKRKKNRKIKQRQIKLIVRVLDPVKNKRRRIFLKTFQVKKAEIVSVPIPKKLFRDAAESPSHSLTVQVLCRNCKRNARLDRVYRKWKLKSYGDSTPILLNPNRPHLVIHTPHPEENEQSSVGRSRAKRHLDSNMCSHDVDPRSPCCGTTSYFSFRELGLDDRIVYPDGFNTVDCIGTCGDTPGAEWDVNSSTSGPFHGVTDSIVSLRSSKCATTSRSHLDIFYFTDSNTIIPARLVDFISDSCGCSSAV